MHKKNGKKKNRSKIASKTGTNILNIFNNWNHQPYQITHPTEYIYNKIFAIEH